MSEVLRELLKEKKIINDNKYYLDGREKRVRKKKLLLVALPFVALLVFGMIFLWYADNLKNQPTISGMAGLCSCAGFGQAECSSHGCSWSRIDPAYGVWYCNGWYSCGGGGWPYCGDGSCGTGEDCKTCVSDCGCGSDEYCGLERNKYKCLSPPFPPRCGDGYCDAKNGEDCSSCTLDCGCTDGNYCKFDLSSGEYSCAKTPFPPRCGDGYCDAKNGEDCKTCVSDCACTGGKACEKNAVTNKYSCIESTIFNCGDGYCSSSESCYSCPGDCGCTAREYCGFDFKIFDYKCTNTSVNCGNLVCDAGEECNNCPIDCGCSEDKYCYDNNTRVYSCWNIPEELKCGDGFCGVGEDCGNCANDCKCELGKNCGYNNITDSYGCKSIDKECENNFCDEENEREESDEEGAEEKDPCRDIIDEVIVEECSEKWICEWGECINGEIWASNCEEANSCGTSKYKPSVKSCISIKEDCTPEFSCTEWSSCQLDLLDEATRKESEFRGTQSRICTDKAKCVIAGTEIRECKVKKPVSVLVVNENNVEVCSERKLVARLITENTLSVDLVLTGTGEEIKPAKMGVDWGKIARIFLYGLIAAGLVVILLLINKQVKKRRFEGNKPVRIVNHLLNLAEKERLKGNKKEAEKLYDKTRFFYSYLIEREKLKVIKKLKKLGNKLA
ncbi:hypothetical protein COV15_03325 [Candidatus Woesearchaeota archaeon CG10_big_fil_rev_8_21_14_0_10_34_12]|nr:MAG: hypothetical protein COV15_03325 [Candidatus Woesearchaeota archaeon CG10_big_fil_rev_8_21_14_0_10_34_12]